MTVGAAGAITRCSSSILDPGDEVIVLTPISRSIRFYIENHGGRVVGGENRRELSARHRAHRAAR